jgi:hypothetical protein
VGEPGRARQRQQSAAQGLWASRLPAGHPEGYLEAFAQLYLDLAEQIVAHRERRAADPAALLVAGIEAGLDGVRFIAAALDSSRRDAGWVALPTS